MFSGCKVSGDQTRKGGLYTRRGYGEQESLERENKLKQANSLCTNCMRQEYPIKKAHNAAYKPGAGEKKSPPEKSFFRHTEYLELFCQYMRKTTLTEQMYSVKVGFEINPTKTLGIMKR